MDPTWRYLRYPDIEHVQYCSIYLAIPPLEKHPAPVDYAWNNREKYESGNHHVHPCPRGRPSSTVVSSHMTWWYVSKSQDVLSVSGFWEQESTDPPRRLKQTDSLLVRIDTGWKMPLRRWQGLRRTRVEQLEQHDGFQTNLLFDTCWDIAL